MGADGNATFALGARTIARATCRTLQNFARFRACGANDFTRALLSVSVNAEGAKAFRLRRYLIAQGISARHY